MAGDIGGLLRQQHQDQDQEIERSSLTKARGK